MGQYNFLLLNVRARAQDGRTPHAAAARATQELPNRTSRVN
jgi:hypothetical protein